MKSRIFVASVSLVFVWFATNVRAESPAKMTLPLWLEGTPGVTVEQPGDGDTPQLLVTLVESESPTAAVVILPGGGYHGLAMSHEGHQIAEWFQSMGVSSAICTYRVRGKGNAGKGYGHPYPMMDAQHAIQTVRAKASEWNIDPDRIGVMGFSAGGHLCSTVSTKFLEGDKEATDPVARVSSRPNFSILCYPVIAFDKPYTHGGSQRNLLGEDAPAELVASLSNESQVSKETPPTFLFHTADDPVVAVDNAVEYFMACRRAGVPAEMHVFPKGRHGVGLAVGMKGLDQWPGLCEQWLVGLGVVKR
ncbi:alpha/beta hydrolase [Stieleria varia]|uniref:Acetylxylan esterase n=1 Tax=Stieleria varia TaxID=2528005 RepID=A0A5C6B3C2_9BACT|nr:alpha/beta hydrolase [Stieleria varia]TWU05776.1 Acetylxylan esterase precursor [Stieleria varia]